MKDYPTMSDIRTLPINFTNIGSRMAILYEVDFEMAVDLLPVTIFVTLMCFLGIIGNSIVVYMYCFNWKEEETVKYFIGYLACLDLTTCVVVMPLEIAMLSHPVVLDHSILCKILRLSRTATSLAAGFILVVIAIDRYRLICKHTHRQIDVGMAKTLCIGTFVAALAFSWPALLVFGKFERGNYSFRETSCSTSEDMKDKIYPVLFYGQLFVLFFTITVCLFVSYGRVAFKICGVSTSNMKNKSRQSSTMTSSSTTDGDTKQEYDSPPSMIDVTIGQHPLKYTESIVYITRQAISTRWNTTFRNRNSRMVRKQKTTLTLFLITALVFCSFLPYMVLTMCKSLIPSFLGSLNKTQQVWYNIGILSHFLSSGLNPLVYGFCSRNFRKKFKTARNELCELIRKRLCKETSASTAI